MWVSRISSFEVKFTWIWIHVKLMWMKFACVCVQGVREMNSQIEVGIIWV